MKNFSLYLFASLLAIGSTLSPISKSFAQCNAEYVGYYNQNFGWNENNLANYVYGSNITVATTTTIHKLGFRAVNLLTGQVKMVIYNTNSGLPTTIIGNTVPGAVLMGDNSYYLTESITLNPGVYFIGLVSNANANFISLTNATGFGYFGQANYNDDVPTTNLFFPAGKTYEVFAVRSNAQTANINDNACGSYTNYGLNYTTPGNYKTVRTVSGAGTNGCDSLYYLNVNVLPNADGGTINHTNCGTYVWNGLSLPNDTVVTKTFVGGAKNGCDSTITLNLTVNNPTTSIDVINECVPFTWINGQTYNASNNSATHTISNAAGCDSVITLNFTAKTPTQYTDVHSACKEFTWLNGVTYTSSNYTATHIIPNAVGCDSVITLDLNIYTVSDLTIDSDGSTLTAALSGASYQWFNCDDNTAIAGETNQTFTPSVAGNYAISIDENGCVDTTNCVYFSTSVGIDEADNAKVVIYPNPTSGMLYVNLNNEQFDNVQILSLDGSILNSVSVKGKAQFEIDMNFNKGIYVLVFNGTNAKHIERIVIK